MSFSILGTGSAVPERVVTNDEISKWVDTNDEWIYTRTGIKQRHIADTETSSSLALSAAQKAIEDSGIDKNEIDLIIFATVRGEYITPSAACILQKALDITCPAFDINAACTGFLYALDVASAYFSAGKVKKVLVVAVEVMSKLLDWNDRSTCVLFGDGAGAAVLGEGDGLLTSFITAEGNVEHLNITYTSSECPLSSIKSGPDSCVHMNGNKVFPFAVQSISRDLKKCMEDTNLGPDDIDWVIPHQANIRIIDSAATKSEIPREKFYVNIDRYANTSCASIPICLDELSRNGKLSKGNNIAMVAFGGGFTTAGCVIRWTKG